LNIETEAYRNFPGRRCFERKTVKMKGKRKRLKKPVKLALTLTGRALLLLTVFLMVKTFLLEVHIQKGEDMYPRVRDGDLLIAEKAMHDYGRNEAVLFRHEEEILCARIIAFAGETVDVNSEGGLMINGILQEEEIFYPTEQTGEISFPFTVPEDCVFVLGDLRPYAADSRSFGAMKTDDVLGRVIFVIRVRGI